MYDLSLDPIERKKAVIRELRKLLAVRGYTSMELSRMTRMNLDNVRKYLRSMKDGENHAYVADWVRDAHDGRWKPLWMYGSKTDAKHPPKCKATIIRDAGRAKEAAKFGKTTPSEQKQRYAAYERQRRRDRMVLNGQMTEQQERALRAAEIKPHYDPYAHFLFGGEKMLAGVSA